MEHCMSAFVKNKHREAYETYVTDCLYTIANAYGHTHGAEENLVSKRFYKCVNESRNPSKEPAIVETKESIANRIRKKIRGEL